MDITAYILSKRYIENSLAGVGALKGKSAYEIAQNNGFKGSESDWLKSLRGASPEVGPNGTWWIDGTDTGVVVAPDLAGYIPKSEAEVIIETLVSEAVPNMIALTQEEILDICK
jgi:hypothetical protein